MNKLRSLVPWVGVALFTVTSVVPLCGCTAMGGTKADSWLANEDTTGQDSDGFPAPSQGVVWQTDVQAFSAKGYTIDPELSAAHVGRVTSRWKISLQPFGGKGYREKVTMRILPVKGSEGYFRLETNVMRQRNDNVAEPNKLTAAEWMEGTRNDSMERLLNNRVEMMFLPGDVSPEFRRQHGMGSKDDPRKAKQVKPVEDESGFLGLPMP